MVGNRRDAVGGEVQQRSFVVLKPGGVLVSITQPPSEEEAAKHRVRASLVVSESRADYLQKIAELANAGYLKAFIGKVYPLSEVKNAWRDALSGRVEGKIAFQVAVDAGRSASAAE